MKDYRIIRRGVFEVELIRIELHDDEEVTMEICRSDFGKCVILRDYTEDDNESVKEFCEEYELEMED